MFKDRTFLIGLGAGVIIGTLLLQIMLIGQTVSTELTEQQLVREADRQGYDLVPKDSVLPSKKDGNNSDTSKADDKAEGVKQNESSDSNQLKSISETKKSELPTAKNKAADNNANKNKLDSKMVSVFIPAKSTSDDISKLLETAGVVKDADDFQQFLQREKKARSLRTGKFQFTLPMSEQDVLQTLLKAPNG
ncbi:endolytic transglycosylase MltG [Paenibacillus agilis]|uniref:Endolytic transglycosylase MltG n=1 Tax=Paenibacillus agilis TaxID=3020863 RepID=A0A559J246_9BACL|nr:endolytic transglycosylase MltG [Paenibacillus agilis]TVX93954.1 endolytic transglycosylase MltG [Paenibacillus agilis]